MTTSCNLDKQLDSKHFWQMVLNKYEEISRLSSNKAAGYGAEEIFNPKICSLIPVIKAFIDGNDIEYKYEYDGAQWRVFTSQNAPALLGNNIKWRVKVKNRSLTPTEAASFLLQKIYVNSIYGETTYGKIIGIYSDSVEITLDNKFGNRYVTYETLRDWRSASTGRKLEVEL